MNKLRKIGLTALAGSLVAVSANAVDLSVTGTSKLTYTTTGGTGANEGETRNLGEVRSRGIELSVGYDPSITNKWSFQNPYYLTMTWTDAEFQTDIGSTDEGAYENIFTGATKGKKVPNVPEIQFALGTAFIFEKLSINLDGQYVDDVFSTGDNATDLTDLDGVADTKEALAEKFYDSITSQNIKLKK